MEEAALVAELSKARTDPSHLKGVLRERLQHFRGLEFFAPSRGGKVAVVTKEGAAAVAEAIAFLDALEASSSLAFEPEGSGLALAAADHLHDRGSLGVIGHVGADGSSHAERQSRYGTWHGKTGECLWFGREGASAIDVVADLVVDDGVPDRGHRQCIYAKEFGVAAAALGKHKTFGAMAVVEFAAAFETDPQRASRRAAAGPPRVAAAAAGGGVQTQWKLGRCAGCKEPISGGSVMEVAGLGKFHKVSYRMLIWQPSPKHPHAHTPYW